MWMARDLGERLLAPLRRVEQLYDGSAGSASSAGGGDVQALDNDEPVTAGEEDPPLGPHSP